MSRPPWRGLLPAAALATTALLAGGGGVPLYDGVGFPDQPYRYVQPPAGTSHGPPAQPAQASSPAIGRNTAELDLQTVEQGPQLALYLPPRSVLAPPAARSVTLTATPLAPDRQPADGTIDGNLYRIAAMADGRAATFGPNAGQSFLYLRAASLRPAPPVMEYRAATQALWRPLQTGRGGADIFVSSFQGAGDYALVHQRGARPVQTGISQETLLLALLAAFILLVGLAVALTRRAATGSAAGGS